MNKAKVWYKRPLAIIGAIAVLIGIFIICVMVAAVINYENKKPNDTAKKPTSVVKVDNHTPNPYEYEIYNSASTGIVPQYRILASDVDYNSPDFQQRIKDTVTAVAKELKTIDFGLIVETDEVCYAFNNNEKTAVKNIYSLTERDAFVSESKRCSDVSIKSNVASYDGGINLQEAKPDTSKNGYRLEFFFNAPKDDPTVGHLKETINGWKPQL